jgi:hypothetical protein
MNLGLAAHTTRICPGQPTKGKTEIGGQGRGRTADLPLFRLTDADWAMRSLPPTPGFHDRPDAQVLPDVVAHRPPGQVSNVDPGGREPLSA